MSPTPVLLLKTRSVPHDGYEEQLVASAQYAPSFVPVLEHKFDGAALDGLEVLIAAGAFSSAPAQTPQVPSYGGLIFTSQRAVEAFATVIERVRRKIGAESDLTRLLPRSLPLYVVGPATARGLRSIALECEPLGEESGNGDALAAFILDHYNNLEPATTPSKPPLLFLVGEKRRDIIPKTLQSTQLSSDKRIEVVETTVYETGVMESFPEAFQSLVGPALKANAVQWVVVFSPTGCEAMLQGLGFLDSDSSRALPKNPERRTFVATIGPTTRDYLKRQFDFEPDVCAATPSPEGVIEGIRSFDIQALRN